MKRRFIHFSVAFIFWSSLAVAQTNQPPQELDLEGEIHVGQEGPLKGISALVVLHGATAPFSAHTWSDFEGKFKFRKLLAGSYTLFVEIPRRAEKRLTIEVSPSFADFKGRVKQVITVEAANPNRLRERTAAVSVKELSIPEEAKKEYSEAQKKLARREIQKAIAHLEKAVSLAPHFTAAINNLGTISYQTQDYTKAERYFREALSKDAEAYEPLVNLGGALLSLGKFQEALEINQQAVAARPQDALANAQLGLSYMALRKDEKAVAYLTRSKKLDPGHFSFPQLALAEIYRRNGQHQSAIHELNEFLKLHPDAPQAKQIHQQLKLWQEK